MSDSVMFDTRNNNLPWFKRNALNAVVAASALLASQFGACKPYKGAEVYSTEEFKYGRFSARIRAAEGDGVLSTLFMYKGGSEKDGIPWEEIDIEVFGKENARKWQSNIITGSKKLEHDEAVHCFEGMTDDGFNTFTLEWTPESITWFVNKRLIRKATGKQVEKLSSPQSLRSNIWASSLVPWVGVFRESILPVAMALDWVEVHSWSNGEFAFLWRDEFDTFDTQRWAKANWTFENNLVEFDPANAFVQNGLLILGITNKNDPGIAIKDFSASLSYQIPTASDSSQPCDEASVNVPKVRFEDLLDSSP